MNTNSISMNKAGAAAKSRDKKNLLVKKLCLHFTR